MAKDWLPPRASPSRARWQFVAGCVGAGILLAGLAEVFLRLFPPRDLHAYLAESSPLTGLFIPDPDFGVAYRSWDALYTDNAERLNGFGPFQSSTDSRRTWAFFGSSFVQAPGMLADHTRATVHNHRVFNLGRNEDLCVRLAQIKMLLANGLGPERIFLVLMPVDLLTLGKQPLSSLYVTSQGALTYRPRLPRGLASWPMRHSRLALTAWARAGLHHGNPKFNRRTLYRGIDEPLRGDVRRLFANLARITQEHQVPVTIILIPSYHQVLEGACYGFQDTLTPLFRQQGYDVLDPRDAFHRHPDPASLYLPDKHLTPAGNELLLSELLAHVCGQEVPTALARER